MTVDLYDRASWRGGAPHSTFAELRRTDPVHWQEIPGQAGYWAVLRHADVIAVSRQPKVYSAEQGGILLEDMDPTALQQLRSMLLAMDPPRHQHHRKPLTVPFGKPQIATLETRVRDICRDILAGIAEGPDGAVVDLVHDVASSLPTRVLGEVLGLPEEDWDHLHHLAALSARTIGESADHEGIAAVSELAVYAIGHAARRRSAVESGEPPPDDVTSLMLASEINGTAMDDLEFALQFVQLFIAGNDTTVGMLANGLDVLLEHPDQLALLRAEPELIGGAVEEIVRYAGPLHYFRRTAMVDTELGGQQIRSGDKVCLYYTSANRDEAVFENPDVFDVRRAPTKHVAFGFGEHFCLGIHLARLEGRIFFEELLGTFARIERAGEPTKIWSNFNNGLDHLPVRLRREDHRAP
ncbi:MAG: cytochrome P450 [Propionibacteriales bacterium]|nr:cytochrome P450 [Propionibacteriales bacterium]